jgi:hypothetical protein
VGPEQQPSAAPPSDEARPSRTKFGYVLRALPPGGMIGLHLLYRRGGCLLGSMSVLSAALLIFALPALLQALSLLSEDPGMGLTQMTPGQALALFATIACLPIALGIHGLASGLLWVARPEEDWRNMMAGRNRARPGNAAGEAGAHAAIASPPVHSEAARQKALEKEQRRLSKEREQRERQLLKERQEREKQLMKERAEREKQLLKEREEAAAAQRARDLELAKLYGGKLEFVEHVRRKSICIGMTRRAVTDSWGEPADNREEITAKSRKSKLFYGRRVGTRGAVSYAHEVTILNDRVTVIKDL